MCPALCEFSYTKGSVGACGGLATQPSTQGRLRVAFPRQKQFLPTRGLIGDASDILAGPIEPRIRQTGTRQIVPNALRYIFLFSSLLESSFVSTTPERRRTGYTCHLPRFTTPQGVLRPPMVHTPTLVRNFYKHLPTTAHACSIQWA